MKPFLIIISLYFQTILTLSFGEESKPSIGRVAVVTEDVTVKGKKFPLKRGDSFHEGDLLQTGQKSFIKILMKDNTLFKIGPRSTFLFQKFSFEKGEKRESIFNLKKGQIQGIFPYKKLKTKKTSVQFKTPVSTFNVTGTEFMANVYKRKGQWKTSVALISGKISIRLPQGQKKRVTLKAGQVFQFQSKIKRKDGKRDKGPKISSLPPKVLKALKNRNPLVNKIFLSPLSRKKMDSSSRFNTPLKKQLKKEKMTSPRVGKNREKKGGQSPRPKKRTPPNKKKKFSHHKKKSFKNKKKLDRLKKKKMMERKRKLRWWRSLPPCSSSVANNANCKCNDYAKNNKKKCFKKP